MPSLPDMEQPRCLARPSDADQSPDSRAYWADQVVESLEANPGGTKPPSGAVSQLANKVQSFAEALDVADQATKGGSLTTHEMEVRDWEEVAHRLIDEVTVEDWW